MNKKTYISPFEEPVTIVVTDKSLSIHMNKKVISLGIRNISSYIFANQLLICQADKIYTYLLKNNTLAKCPMTIDIRLIHADCIYAANGNRLLIYNSQLKPIADCKLASDILNITVHRKKSINVTFVSGPTLNIDLDIS